MRRLWGGWHYAHLKETLNGEEDKITPIILHVDGTPVAGLNNTNRRPSIDFVQILIFSYTDSIQILYRLSSIMWPLLFCSVLRSRQVLGARRWLFPMDVIACPRPQPYERVHIPDISNQRDSEDECVDESRIQDHCLVFENAFCGEMALPWAIRREPPRS